MLLADGISSIYCLLDSCFSSFSPFFCSKIHILGSFQNIRTARHAICNLILGELCVLCTLYTWQYLSHDCHVTVYLSGCARLLLQPLPAVTCHV